jgi:heat-inducible transcriptional repressor
MKHLTYERLTDRQREVLGAIVRLYVASAHPVSSRQLAKSMGKRLSPATLRNAMADLEELGFLAQPHTSAGRVPTELAYRAFVDQMVDFSETMLTPGQQKSFRENLGHEASPGGLLEQTSTLLSKETGCASIITLPDFSRAACKHMEFVHLHGRTVLAILVSDSGLVQQRVIQTQKELPQEDLQQISRFVNDNFSGLPLGKLRERILEMMHEDKRLYDRLLANALELASRALEGGALSSPDLRIEASSRMLGQPEFANVERMREVYRAFDQKSQLLHLLNSCLEQDSPVVIIGSELELPEIKDFTLVTSSYKFGERSLGSVGVLGPMRMDYPRVTAWVGFAGQMLSQIISGKEDLSVE